MQKTNKKDPEQKKIKVARRKILSLLTEDLIESRDGVYFTKKVTEICTQNGVEPWKIQELQDKEPKLNNFFFSGDPLNEKEEGMLDLARPWLNDPLAEKPEFGFFFSVGPTEHLEKVWKARGLSKEENLYRLKKCGVKTPKDSIEYAVKILKDPSSTYRLQNFQDLVSLSSAIVSVFKSGKLNKVEIVAEISKIVHHIDGGQWDKLDLSNLSKDQATIIKSIIKSFGDRLKADQNRQALLLHAESGRELCIKLELEGSSKKEETTSTKQEV